MISNVQEIGGMDEHDDPDQHERDRRKKPGGKPPFRGKRTNFQAKLHSTSKQRREPVENLGQVSAGFTLDVDRNGKEGKIGLPDSPREMVERGILIQAEGDLVRQNPEFAAD